MRPSHAQQSAAFADLLHATHETGPIAASHVARALRMFGLKLNSLEAACTMKRAGWIYAPGGMWSAPDPFPGVDIDAVHRR